MAIKTTRYYEEFLRYFELATKQQELCNLGIVPHADSGLGDDLMHYVELYDVVERKLAGFSQIVNDAFYGWTPAHPYWDKMQSGHITPQREQVAKAWTGKQAVFGLEEWLYIFILHRVCGSAINYATKPSGYYNTLMFHLHECDNIDQMIELVNSHPTPFYTSVGYQFPAFPKPPKIEHSNDLFVGMNGFTPNTRVYKRGGDYYLSEFAPRLARDLARFLEQGERKTLREIGEFMFKWNQDNGLRVYRFQYAAVIADIADWYPQFVHRESMFYYGTNAVECIGYLADPIGYSNKKSEQFLDEVMNKIFADTNSLPYNAEDVACDFIRWVENYVRPGADYAHLDYDAVWSSCTIKDHPFGRQRAMIDLGLIPTFKGMTAHPSDDKIIKDAGLTIEEYKQKVNELYK
jgi:hypothetical protein